MLRFYRNNYFVLGDTCFLLSSSGHLHGELHIRYCLLSLSSARLFPVSISASFYPDKVSTNRNENIFCQPTLHPTAPSLTCLPRCQWEQNFQNLWGLRKEVPSVQSISGPRQTNTALSSRKMSRAGRTQQVFPCYERQQGWWCHNPSQFYTTYYV